MAEILDRVYVTAYTWHDNTPPGSPDISDPEIHQSAGGIGTFNDPWTLAVGWDDEQEPPVLQFPRGTRFYLTHLNGYAVVEDRCGNPPNTRDKPCWKVEQQGVDQGATHQIDVWIGGEHASGKEETDRAASELTRTVRVIRDPSDDQPVPYTGEVFELWKQRHVPVSDGS